MNKEEIYWEIEDLKTILSLHDNNIYEFTDRELKKMNDKLSFLHREYSL